MTARQKTWSGQLLSISENPIISLKEARKILGKEYDSLPDGNLQGVIISLTKIGDTLLNSIKVPNKEMV